MRLAFFIIALLFPTVQGMAQDLAAAVTAAHPEATFPRQGEVSRYIASPATIARSDPGRTSSFIKSTFLVDTAPGTDRRTTDGTGRGIIADWRERVFKSLSTSLPPHRPLTSTYTGPISNNELAEQAQERRTATKIVLRETLNYAREQVPEIDTLIRSLKFEISNRPSSETGRTTSAETTHTTRSANGSRPPDDKLYIKTGLRLPVENKKVCVLSETEAQYGTLTSFVEVNLDGSFDRRSGLTYSFGRDARLQVARYDVHGADPVTGESRQTRTSLNLVQLIVAF
jgi:hypothetical protein